MLFKDDLKDWQIAKLMFGTNTKNDCKIVKQLRLFGEVTDEVEDDYWIGIKDKRKTESLSWLIPRDCIKIVI